MALSAPLQEYATRAKPKTPGQGVEVLGVAENIAASVEGKTTGGRDDKRSGDVEGTSSDGDLQRVKAARLAVSPEPPNKSSKPCKLSFLG